MAPHVTQAANDKDQVEPMLGKLRSLPEGMNHPDQRVADTGFFSEKNVQVCNAAGSSR
ncbi:hypothetical protein ABZN20_14350 [Methylococcus sp. ANG]